MTFPDNFAFMLLTILSAAISLELMLRGGSGKAMTTIKIVFVVATIIFCALATDSVYRVVHGWF